MIVPHTAYKSSQIKFFAWINPGLNSYIFTPLLINVVYEFLVRAYTIFLSGICGVIIITSTPRFAALINALVSSLSIIKYGVVI